ncbi:MAG: VOC family protein [Acidimicrobiaceae bacterium]|nr:VOC family protein [Acidimicrobiaceae bacterium]MCY3642724.1 VOC family protein [Acidimicrobiaceae bacterium]MDE0493511.1 VOC family protein [Acidimicrobiaceae bacterium]MDE0666170.1 VOC family protein [Acidimicrobiaceae bacterium]MXY11414.1 VOC family protein [Acidimicrobiaceae bacterium]
MARTITKPGFDLGIVTTNGDAMLEFYRDVVGLEFEATLALEAVGIARMDRLRCNDSVLKLVTPVADVSEGTGGGIEGCTGLRYFTMSVDDVTAAAADCEAAGAPVVWSPMEVRPGVMIAMVEDPDGNWVEFIQMS